MAGRNRQTRWERWRRFLREEDGPTGAEYAILLALLVLSAMPIVGSIGSRVQVIYEHIREGVGACAG